MYTPSESFLLEIQSCRNAWAPLFADNDYYEHLRSRNAHNADEEIKDLVDEIVTLSFSMPEPYRMSFAKTCFDMIVEPFRIEWTKQLVQNIFCVLPWLREVPHENVAQPARPSLLRLIQHTGHPNPAQSPPPRPPRYGQIAPGNVTWPPLLQARKQNYNNSIKQSYINAIVEEIKKSLDSDEFLSNRSRIEKDRWPRTNLTAGDLRGLQPLRKGSKGQ